MDRWIESRAILSRLRDVFATYWAQVPDVAKAAVHMKDNTRHTTTAFIIKRLPLANKSEFSSRKKAVILAVLRRSEERENIEK